MIGVAWAMELLQLGERGRQVTEENELEEESCLYHVMRRESVDIFY